MKPKAGALRRSTKLDKLAKLMRGEIGNIRNKRDDFKRIIRVYTMSHFMPINLQFR